MNQEEIALSQRDRAYLSWKWAPSKVALVALRRGVLSSEVHGSAGYARSSWVDHVSGDGG
jgi:hypothetical protein